MKEKKPATAAVRAQDLGRSQERSACNHLILPSLYFPLFFFNVLSLYLHSPLLLPRSLSDSYSNAFTVFFDFGIHSYYMLTVVLCTCILQLHK